MSDQTIRVDQRPPIQKTIPLSLQHLFAMFGSTVLVPILFNVNPATVLLFNGIGTILYLILCKGKIPAYLGSSFAFISPVFAVMSQYSYEAALGGFIVVGAVFVLVGLIIRAVGTAWIDFIFPPAAMGAIVAVIGLELMPVAAGMAGLILLKGTTDIYSPKVVRAAMGSLFHLPVVSGVTEEAFLSFARESGLCLYATALDAKARPYDAADFTGPTAIVFGNEGQGVSEPLLASSETLYIPMYGGAESLNVAVSTAIVLYEAVRQRHN